MRSPIRWPSHDVGPSGYLTIQCHQLGSLMGPGWICAGIGWGVCPGGWHGWIPYTGAFPSWNGGRRGNGSGTSPRSRFVPLDMFSVYGDMTGASSFRSDRGSMRPCVWGYGWDTAFRNRGPPRRACGVPNAERPGEGPTTVAVAHRSPPFPRTPPAPRGHMVMVASCMLVVRRKGRGDRPLPVDTSARGPIFREVVRWHIP